MTIIRPTQRWHSRTIQVPFLGRIQRPRSSDGSKIHSFDVPEKAVDYLIKNNLATLVAPEDMQSINSEEIGTDNPDLENIPLHEIEKPEGNDKVQSSEDPVENQDPEEDKLGLAESGEVSFDPNQLDAICEFLNRKTKIQLMEVRGIGARAANAIMRAKPINREKVLSILKENQIAEIAEAISNG